MKKALHILLAAAAGALAAAVALRERPPQLWSVGSRTFVDSRFLERLLDRAARLDVLGDVVQARIGGEAFRLREVSDAEHQELALRTSRGSVYEVVSGPIPLLVALELVREVQP